jgi:hypothetical protein
MNNLTLLGMYYRGQDLQDLFGISFSDFATNRSYTENGGYGKLTFDISDSLSVSGAYAYAEIEDSNLIAAGTTVVKNNTILGNVVWTYAKNMNVGLEVSQLTTYFSNNTNVTATRYQASTSLTF